MIELWVEISHENPPLARAEIAGVCSAVGGEVDDSSGAGIPSCVVPVRFPDERVVQAVAQRLALSRRILAPFPQAGAEQLAEVLRREGGRRRSASIRPFRHPGLAASETVRRLGAFYVAGGGTIALSNPSRRFFLVETDPARLAEEVALVDRSAAGPRRRSTLPFRRPITLPARLGRVAANLAGIRPGDQVVDPFVGTGALLVEAGLLGARLYGVDREVAMVRGAERNLASVGLSAERLFVGDAAEAVEEFRSTTFDAVLTDPPYGRASSTGGEGAASLVARVIPQYANLVRPGGRVVIIGPQELSELPRRWRLEVAVPDRVHRSLTRYFRVYRRPDQGSENVTD